MGTAAAVAKAVDIPTGTITILQATLVALTALKTTLNPTPTGMKTLGLDVEVVFLYVPFLSSSLQRLRKLNFCVSFLKSTRLSHPHGH
jgi:hypothetical protein